MIFIWKNRMKSQINEKLVEKSIMKRLRIKGHYCQKVHSWIIKTWQGKRTRRVHLADKWTPDLLACVAGRFVWIEMKKDSKEVEKWNKQKTDRDIWQMKQGKLIQKAEGLFCVVSSIEELNCFLENNIKE